MKSKKQLLLLLLILPTSLIFSILKTSVAGAEYIPEENYFGYNQWHWHNDVNIDTQIIFEEETIVRNATSGELMTQYRMLMIYNITDFENNTIAEPEFSSFGPYSIIVGEELYYNCTSKELMVNNNSDGIIAAFGFDNSSYTTHYHGLEETPIPVILPINGTVGQNVNVDDNLAECINSTYFKPFSDAGLMNSYENYYTTGQSLYYEAYDNQYYLNASYFNNGTLQYADTHYLFNIENDTGTNGLVNLTVKLKRVFKYDYLLDGIQWSFSEGDTFYFGDNHKWQYYDNGPQTDMHYDEIEIKIDEIGNKTIEVKVGPEHSYFQCFSYVRANISLWNYQMSTYEKITDSPVLMGMANALCPANMEEIMGGEMEYFEDKNVQIMSTPNSYDLVVFSHSNNQSWLGAEISKLDGMDGMDTGDRYEIVNVALNIPAPGFITITVDKPHTFGSGNWSTIRPMPVFRPDFVFYPMNTDPKDVEFVTYPMITHMADYEYFFTFSDGSFVANHSTYNDEMKGKYNIATGIAEWSWSKYDTGEFRSIKFRKNQTILPIGTSERMLYPQEVVFSELGNMQLHVNYTSTMNTEMYSAVLPFNPVFEPLYAEINTMPLYFDLYTTYPTMVSNINIRVEYDQSLLGTLDENYLMPYAFNMSIHQWQACPEAFFTIYPTQDEIVISLPSFMPNLTYYALGASKEWSWDVYHGELYTFLCQGEINGTEGLKPYNDFSTLNITSITEITQISDVFTRVNATSMYFDPSPSIMGLVSSGWSHAIGEYGIRSSDGALQMKFDSQSWGIPAIVPLQYGNLNLEDIGSALRDFFISTEASSMGFPAFDGWIVSGNNLYISIAGENYYLNLTYANNGILEKWDVFSTTNDDGTIAEFRLEGKLEDDINPVNEIQWGVDVGDVFYFGSPPMGKMKVNITAVAINYTHGMGMDGPNDLRLSIFNSTLGFSHVLADIYMWDDTNLLWDLTNSSSVIATANDYFFFAMNSNEPLLIPIGITGWDVFECFKPFMNVMGIDTLVEAGNDYLRLGASGYEPASEGPFVDWYFDSTSGITELIVGKARFGPDPEDLQMFGIYEMTYNDISTPSVQIFEFLNPLMPGFRVTANITTTGNMELLYALISDLPTSATIGNGTILFFSDMLIPNPANIISMRFTFQLPSIYNPLEDFESYHFWIWDESLSNPDFTEIDASIIEGAILGTTSSSLTINFAAIDLDGAINIIFAITIGDDGEEEYLVPGYDVILILGAISLSSIMIYLKKRRRM